MTESSRRCNGAWWSSLGSFDFLILLGFWIKNFSKSPTIGIMLIWYSGANDWLVDNSAETVSQWKWCYGSCWQSSSSLLFSYCLAALICCEAGSEIHSFRLFYSTPSSPLLLRGASDDSTDTVLEFHAEAPQATATEGLAQGPYVATRAGLEPASLRTKGEESTNERPRPTRGRDVVMCL